MKLSGLGVKLVNIGLWLIAGLLGGACGLFIIYVTAFVVGGAPGG